MQITVAEHNEKTIDCSTTGNMIQSSFAKYLSVTINESFQSTHQIDGSSLIIAIRETCFMLSSDEHELTFEALVEGN